MPDRIIRETRTITYRVNRRVTKRTEHSVTHTSEYDRTESVSVRIEINVTALLDTLGVRAARSISGKSVEAGGLVTVKRIGKPTIEATAETETKTP